MKEPAPTVAIVIPCHRYGRFLAQALVSALAQTVPPRQIVVVDDGSEDETRQVAASYGPRIETVRISHGGVCHARN